jgi:hypothetical protein
MFFVRLLSLVMAEAAIVGLFVEIPIVSNFAFWIMVGAYLLWIGINRMGEKRIKWQLILSIGASLRSRGLPAQRDLGRRAFPARS